MLDFMNLPYHVLNAMTYLLFVNTIIYYYNVSDELFNNYICKSKLINYSVVIPGGALSTKYGTVLLEEVARSRPKPQNQLKGASLS